MEKNSAEEILSFVIENGLQYRDADGNYLTEETWGAVEFEARRNRGLVDSVEIANEAVGLLGAGPFK